MRSLFVIPLFLLCSCVIRIATTEIILEADKTRVAMMRTESDVYGDFFQLRIFHSDLMQVTNTPDQIPYTSLDSLFGKMRLLADEVITRRMQYDSVYKKVKSLSEAEKPKKSAENLKLLHQYDSLKIELPPIQSKSSITYFELRKEYDAIKSSYGIKRLGMEDLAALTNEKVIVWLDSLEEVGRMVGKEKQDLRQRYPSQKGTEFFQAYQPVSMLEAKMKDIESMIAQLQNSQSRFEEGNKQDFIYFGPNIRARLEVQATDNIVSALALAMSECRKLETDYWSYKPKR